MSPAPSGGEAGDGSVSANLKLRVGAFELQARLTVPAAPIKPQAVLPALQALVNAVVNAAERELEGTGRTVSCKAGCGACCRQAVPIAAVEAYHIRDLVEAMPEPRRSVIKARFDDARRRLGDAGLYDTLRDPGRLSLKQRQLLGLDYFALGIACPFLEDESCSIHLDRPLSCREYLVTSPAERCSTPEIGVDPVKVPMLSHSLQRIGTDDDRRWVPLSLALDWVAANPDNLPLRSGPEWVQDILSRIGKGPPADDAGSETTLPTPAGDVAAGGMALPMPPGEVSAVDMLPTFRAYADGVVDEAIAWSVANGKTVSCRAGCAACCRQFVVISTTEARRIAALVEAMPEPRRSRVRARFEDVDRRIAEWSTSVGFGRAAVPAKRMTERELASSYVGLWIACPLLEDEKCSIYEDRPLVCREYLVTSPAEYCSRLHEPDVQVEPVPRLFTARALDHLLSDESPPAPSRIALAQALRWVGKNPYDSGAPARTAEAWLNRFLDRLQQAEQLDGAPPAEAASSPAAPAVPEPATLQIDVPAEPVPARAVLPALRAMADAAVQHAIALVEAQGRHISCKAGCGACCDQLVPIGPIEAHMIADLVEKLPEPRRGVVRARFAAAEARLAAWRHRPDLDNVDRMAGEAKYQMSLEYFRLGITCPFLEDGSCSIYEDRPLVCREYLVTSPAAHCARQGDPTAQISMVVVTSTNHALALLPHDNPADLLRLPLTLALSWSAAHPEKPDKLPGRVWVERFIDRLRMLEERRQAQ